MDGRRDKRKKRKKEKTLLVAITNNMDHGTQLTNTNKCYWLTVNKKISQ